jgi:hypothetical protein
LGPKEHERIRRGREIDARNRSHTTIVQDNIRNNEAGESK